MLNRPDGISAPTASGPFGGCQISAHGRDCQAVVVRSKSHSSNDRGIFATIGPCSSKKGTSVTFFFFFFSWSLKVDGSVADSPIGTCGWWGGATAKPRLALLLIFLRLQELRELDNGS